MGPTNMPQQQYHNRNIDPISQLDNQDYFRIPTNLNTNMNTVGNSIASYQKFIPPYPHMRNVSDLG